MSETNNKEIINEQNENEQVNNENATGKKQSGSRKSLIWVGVLAALILICAGLLFVFKPGTNKGGKTIAVEVIHKDGTTKDFTINTDSEFLRGALEQEQLVQGNETEYGLYLMTVDGETADESNQEWWGVTQNGEMCNYGVDEQPIADKEHYELTLNVGW